jgi:hypothetical protein
MLIFTLGFFIFVIMVSNVHQIFPPVAVKGVWCVPKLLNGFKCESELKTTKEQGVKAHSLTHNTLGVEKHDGVSRWD